MQQPSYLDTLLYSCVMDLKVLTTDAYPVREPENVPSQLRRLIRGVKSPGQSWGCWTDDNHHWFFIAELPLTRGTPLLRLHRYGESGELRQTSNWRCDDNEQWHQVVAQQS